MYHAIAKQSRSILYTGALLATTGLGAAATQAQASELLVELRANGSLENTGDMGGQASLIGGAAFGEGLAPGNNSGFDNTAGGAITLPNAGDELAGLESMTFSAFVKSEAPVTEGPANFLFHDQTFQTFVRGRFNRIRAGYGSADGSSREITSSAREEYHDVVDEWLFIAVASDGIAGETHFYIGTESSGVLEWEMTRSGSGDAWAPLAGNGGDDLFFGNNNSNLGNPFEGLMDNIRIHGSYTDSSGALSESQLSDIFDAGIAEIPEPASAALLGGLGAMLLWRRRD